jgi:hypothetical protein
VKKIILTIVALACVVVLPGIANANDDTTIVINAGLSPNISIPNAVTTGSASLDAAITVHPTSHGGLGYGLEYWTDSAGLQSSIFVTPQSSFRESAFMPSVGIRLVPHTPVFLNAGFLSRNVTVDSESITFTGAGIGIDTTPNLTQAVSGYASFWYYPTLTGNLQQASAASVLGFVPSGSVQLQTSLTKYRVGTAYRLNNKGMFLDFGYFADQYNSKNEATNSFARNGFTLGLGIKK